MKILRHRLHQDDGTPVEFTASPNRGGKVDPRYLVVHYAASSSFAGAVSSLANPDVKVSAHLVIGREGQIGQLVPFDRVAWHAGASQWEGLSGLNNYSIGIELDNAGKLERSGDQGVSWFGRTYNDDEVIEAAHKNGGPSAGWHRYTEAQLNTLIDVGRVLVHKYGLLDVVGHDDIAPGRKSDPGPAFPLGSVRSRIYGRADNEAPVFVATTGLNIRTGPGAGFAKVIDAGLPQGTRMHVIAEQGRWRHVDVLDVVAGQNDLEGWAHGRFIERQGA